MTIIRKTLRLILQILADWKTPLIKQDTLCEMLGMERRPVRRILKKLQEEELLSTNCPPKKKNQTWILVERSKYLDRLQATYKNGPVRDKLWKLMRMRQTFTRDELIAMSEVNYHTVFEFVKLLEVNGYVKRASKKRYGTIYRLVKDTGPKRPIFKEI